MWLVEWALSNVNEVCDFSELCGTEKGNEKSHRTSQNPCIIWTNLTNTPPCFFFFPKKDLSLEAWILDLPCSRENLSYSFLLSGVVYNGKNPLHLPFEVPFSFCFIEHPWGFMKVLWGFNVVLFVDRFSVVTYCGG